MKQSYIYVPEILALRKLFFGTKITELRTLGTLTFKVKFKWGSTS
jgi:hypothetical protein